MQPSRIAVPLLLLGMTSQARSQAIWYADPGQAYTKNFYRLSVEAGEAGTVTTVNDPVYGKVWSVNKPAGSKRAELARPLGYVPAEGDKVYVGWRWKCAIAGNTNPAGVAIFQNKSDGENRQNYPILMGYDGTNIGLSAYDTGSGSQASRGKGLWHAPIAEGRWVTIVLGIKFSRSQGIGSIELWFNGIKQNLTGQIANQVAMWRTLDDNGNYFKWGAYNENSRAFDITVNLDEMRVAKDYASADPNTYSKVPPTSSIDPSASIHRSLTVFPNPARGVVQIQGAPGSWTFLDLAGRKRP